MPQAADLGLSIVPFESLIPQRVQVIEPYIDMEPDSEVLRMQADDLEAMARRREIRQRVKDRYQKSKSQH